MLLVIARERHSSRNAKCRSHFSQRDMPLFINFLNSLHRMSNIALTVESINNLQPLDIVTNENVRSRFIQIWDTLWGAGSGEVG